MDLREILGVLRRRPLLLSAIFFAVVITAAVVTWRITPIYEATARVEVLPAAPSSSGQLSLENLFDSRSGLHTQVELIRSEQVLGRAAGALELPDSALLSENLSVQLLPDTQIVEIRIQNEDPDEARLFANTVAESYIDYRRERAEDTTRDAAEAIVRQMQEMRTSMAALDATGQAEVPGTPEKIERDRLAAQLGALEGQLLVLPDAEALRQGGGSIITAAETPQSPVRPRKAVNLGLAVVVGLALAVGAAFLAETLDDRLKGAEDVERLLGVPVLGHIPVVDAWSGQETASLSTESEASSSAAEAYRTLRTNLRFVSLDAPLRKVLVTSPTSGAGKTTTSVNLAAVLARGGSKTILVGGDLRKPTAHRALGLDNKIGITQALEPGTSLHKLLQSHKYPNLKLLSSGGTPPNPTEVLASVRFGEILDQLAGVSDVLIVDSPPILGLGDSSALASRVDGVLMVVNIALTTRKELADAADQLRKAGGRIIGCVLNAVDAKDGYGYYYQNYYAEYVAEQTAPINGSGTLTSDDFFSAPNGTPAEGQVQPAALETEPAEQDR